MSKIIPQNQNIPAERSHNSANYVAICCTNDAVCVENSPEHSSLCFQNEPILDGVSPEHTAICCKNQAIPEAWSSVFPMKARTPHEGKTKKFGHPFVILFLAVSGYQITRTPSFRLSIIPAVGEGA